MKIISLFILLCWASVAFGVEGDVPGTYVPAKAIRDNASRVNLELRSHAAIVFDEQDNEVIMARNAEEVVPVASLSKLMTAMVILDADQGMEEVITITKDDKDRIRYSKSHLRTPTIRKGSFSRFLYFFEFWRRELMSRARRGFFP